MDLIQLLKHRAAVVHGENLGRALIRLDQRTRQLLERQRIVEEGRVDDRPRDRQLAARHGITTRPATVGRRPERLALLFRIARRRTIAQPAVRNISVPSVAQAAPSIDSAGISRAFSARFTTSARAQSVAYARWPSQPTS